MFIEYKNVIDPVPSPWRAFGGLFLPSKTPSPTKLNCEAL